MKSLFPVFLLFIVPCLPELTASSNESCHWKHRDIVSNHTVTTSTSRPTVENQSSLLLKDSWYVAHSISFLWFFFSDFFQSHLITQLLVTMPVAGERVSHSHDSHFLPHIRIYRNPPAIHPSIQNISTSANE